MMRSNEGYTLTRQMQIGKYQHNGGMGRLKWDTKEFGCVMEGYPLACQNNTVTIYRLYGATLRLRLSTGSLEQHHDYGLSNLQSNIATTITNQSFRSTSWKQYLGPSRRHLSRGLMIPQNREFDRTLNQEFRQGMNGEVITRLMRRVACQNDCGASDSTRKQSDDRVLQDATHPPL